MERLRVIYVMWPALGKCNSDYFQMRIKKVSEDFRRMAMLRLVKTYGSHRPKETWLLPIGGGSNEAMEGSSYYVTSFNRLWEVSPNLPER